jgi:hypothetical protein
MSCLGCSKIESRALFPAFLCQGLKKRLLRPLFPSASALIGDPENDL